MRMSIPLFHASPKRAKLCFGWLAGTFEKAGTGKLVYEWITDSLLTSGTKEMNQRLAGYWES